MELLCKIRDVYRIIHEFESQFQTQYDLSLNEGMLLCSIDKHMRCSSGEVAEMLGITASNASKIISVVEKKGFIRRVVGKDDKRQMYFSLTSEGKEKLKSVKHNVVNANEILKKIKEI